MHLLNLNNGSEKNVIVVALNEFISLVSIDPRNNPLTEWESQKLGEFSKIIEVINDIDYIGIEGEDGINLFIKILLNYKRILIANINNPLTEQHPLLKIYFKKRFESTQILIKSLHI